MTVQVIDGFDMYNGTGANTGLQAKWFPVGLSSGISMVTGRFGGQGMQIVPLSNNNKQWCRSLPSAQTSIAFGFAFFTGSLPSGGPVQIAGLLTGSGTTSQVAISLNADGSLSAVRASGPVSQTVLGTTAGGVIAPSTWYYIEAEIVLNATTGSFNIYVSGSSVLALTGQNTLNSGTTADTLFFGNSSTTLIIGGTHIFDDLYTVSTNTRLGERRVETLRPASDNTKVWTPDTGVVNFSRVNETNVDGDTSYVASSTVGQRDLYTIGSLSSTPATIDAVQVSSFAEKTDASTRTLANSVQSAGTDSDGSAFSLATNYGKFERIIANDPNGGGSWTPSRVNNLLIGPKLAA